MSSFPLQLPDDLKERTAVQAETSDVSFHHGNAYC